MMTATDYARIRRELEQLQQGTTKADRKDPVFDFGLFVLMYFFALVILVTGMLAVGIPLQQYAALYAIPFAWLGLAWFRKAPFYALLVSVAGVLFLAACSLLVSQLFDMAWDSNCYHKPDTGMLKYGWNPFEQTMTSYANSTSYLPYNSGWLSYQVDNQPKASFIIGASFYALTGNIAFGKVFNIAGIVACVCIIAPLIRDAFKLHPIAAFIAVLLASANPISLAQSLSYYNDGFVYQMLTIAAASFAYALYKPEGRYVRLAMAAAFMAVCMAINIKTSAALFCALICIFFYIMRVIAINQSEAPPEIHRKKQWRLFWYFVLMVIFALVVLGATTYVINTYRYSNPFYGMLGSSSINTLLESLMSPKIHALPLFLQFFVSLFSPTINELFTDISLKIPFTFSNAEWNLMTLDANVSGWGIIFSGIFLISLIVIFRAIHILSKRKSRKVKFLVAVLIMVFLPVFIIPYLFSARYYLQLFWLPLTALICLFAPSSKDVLKVRGPKRKNTVWVRLLGVLLCLLLFVNCITAYNYINMQINETKSSRETLAFIKDETQNNGKVMDFTPMIRGLFYGLIFNLQDEGITRYHFTEHITEIQGNVLYYLAYNLRERGSDEKADAYSFLYSLNQNRYIVVIAKQGTSSALDSRMLALMDAMALQTGQHDSQSENYLTVIDSDAHIRAEENGAQAINWQGITDKLDVTVQSTGSLASIIIDGTQYALSRDGYNIVVYDPVNDQLVDSVVINPDTVPVLTR